MLTAGLENLKEQDGDRDIAIIEILDDALTTRIERRGHEDNLMALVDPHVVNTKRSRIGRELHDHISQMLGVLTIRIDQLRIDASTPPEVAATLEQLRKSTVEITNDIHSLSHRLHSSALDYLGLVAALERLVTEFSVRHQIAIEFSHREIPEALSSDVALSLFRVTEESLTNIAKHSQSTTARVDVSGAADGIHLTIQDAGRGFDPASLERKEGLGFVSMRERLRAVHGTVRVDSAPSRGTTIEVVVPATALVVQTETPQSHLPNEESFSQVSRR